MHPKDIQLSLSLDGPPPTGWTEFNCENCGAPFRRRSSEVASLAKRERRPRFCSRACDALARHVRSVRDGKDGAPKRCWACGETKPRSEFTKKRSRSDGFSDRCRACDRERNRARSRRGAGYAKKEQLFTFLTGLKGQLGCQACGESCAACLDFHHVDPAAKGGGITVVAMTVSRLEERTQWRRLAEELAKCICLCANCHRKAHAGIITVAGLPTIRLTDGPSWATAP